MIKLANIQTEVDASYLYKVLAENEKDPHVAQVFHEMHDIERGHAISFLKQNGMDESALPGPSGRAITLNRIGKLFGYDYVLGVLLDTEKNLAVSVQHAR
ncbi:MAG: ferritin family protein, partial [Bacteroidota bacterium]